MRIRPGEGDLIKKIVLLLCLLAFPSIITAGTLPERILFIGNSYTLYNGGLDTHLGGLVAASGHADSCVIVRKIQGGATLSSHWHTYASQNAIDTTLDMVILQGYLQRRAAIDSFMSAARLFCTYAESAGVRPVLLANWGNPYGMVAADMDNAAIAAVFDSAASLAGAEVIHAGMAFDGYAAPHPESLLLCDDIAHPSPLGTYLTACCIYVHLAGDSPAGFEYDGGLAGVEGWRRTYLQELAWHVAGNGPPAQTVVQGAGEHPGFRAWYRGGLVRAIGPFGYAMQAFDVSGTVLPAGPGYGTWRCSGPGIYLIHAAAGHAAPVLLRVSVPFPQY